MAGRYRTKKKPRRALLPLLLLLALAAAACILLLRRGGADADWQLRLVNPWHAMPADYAPELTDIGGGQAVDARCADALLEMLEDCRSAGLSPVVCSSYRTWETQQALYDNKIARVMAEGYSEADAPAVAATVVAVPGTSEHQLGLAVDIVDAGYMEMDEAQEQTAVQQWLMAHCQEYGFILRYPTGKSETTGIIYEPWHYRYVGREAAQEITARGICLEEYLASR